MNLIAIDTHEAIKSLELAGLSESAAEALIATIRVVIKNMVTKTDLQAAVQGLNGRIDTTNERITGLKNAMDERFDGLKNTLNARIDGLETNMNTRMELLKRSIVIQLGGIMCTAVGVIVAAMKLL